MTNLQRLFSFVYLVQIVFCAPLSPNSNTFTDLEEFSKVTENMPLDTKSLLFEGDIAGIIEPGMTATELRSKLDNWSKSGVFAHQRWPNGQVAYQISSVFGAEPRNLIIQAMSDIETKTSAVQFVQRTWQNDYVNIVHGNGCSSFVGKNGGPQALTLGNGCFSVGTIIHELMHAIGFFHEQSRPDRDSYVDINWSNIQAVAQSDFQSYASDTFGTSYDFGSIMHYPRNMFAVNPASWTIQPKPQFAGSSIGQLTALSSTDIQEIRAMYGVSNPVNPGTPITPVTPGTGKTCAMLWHGLNFGGKKVTLTSGQSGNLEAADQGQVKSAIISAGCKLTTYSAAGFQGVPMVYPTFATSEGFFNLIQSCSSIRCTCV